ncbi:MAG: hypothetical protein J6V50_03800, partial [Clostridia bacterium]|nr:hypothetical protein [Clostridia bacterium]
SGGIFAYYAHPVTGFAVIGAGLILAGVSIFLFFGCQYLTSGTVTLTKKCAVWLKSFFLKRRGAKS